MADIRLPARIVALLLEGFELAGDGGMDPFTKRQRDEVNEALIEHDDILTPELKRVYNES